MKSYFKIIFLLLIPLLLIIAYSKWGGYWWLEKIDLPDLEDAVFRAKGAAVVSEDSVCGVPMPLDTASHKILFFGDSMLEGLSRRLCDYAMENGHDLTSVVWYSSTSKEWAECDTLEHFISQVSPTFIVVCLCSNELFVRDLKDRDKYIARIVEKIGDVPFVWISPPNWKEDTGINELIIKNVGKDRYFDSRHLELKRGRDKVHPTFVAAEGWMDSVAVWMNGANTRHPIKMSVPMEKRTRKYRQVLLMPLE